uniref:UTP--glucose-1-phosphate uridylyltransferase n=1 Tax=Agathobacter sp. TaxID=2021311 RepID=UPI004055B7DD
MKQTVIDKINNTNQKYLKPLLGKAIPQRMVSQLNSMDWSYLDMIGGKEHARGTFAPLGAMELPEIESRKEEFKKVGLEAIRNCKVGAILLAGGQGTRLGFDKAKGMYNIGVTKDLYIFEQLIANLKKVTDEAGAFVPLYIMTSDKNDEQTRMFFEEHDFFGYNKEFVKFFVQEMVPAVDFEGNVLVEAEDSLAMSPNGNGGWFLSLVKAGLGEDLKEKGVEWLNVFAVDNVLQKIADPVFTGATILSGCVSGAKVVRKCDPYERVGALCLEDGKPSIIEYYELTPEMAEAKNESGSLLYGFGVILNYLFDVKTLFEISEKQMPLHIVEKKVPYMDENGNAIKPETPNAYKFETLILDMIYMMDNCLSFEVEREKEFAPVKNAAGVDSVESARALLSKNGIEI